MTLTDAVCRSAKPGPKRRKLSDESGLQLWVQSSGARLWQLAYRFDGRQRQLALGAYPDLSLAEARIKREDANRGEQALPFLGWLRATCQGRRGDTELSYSPENVRPDIRRRLCEQGMPWPKAIPALADKKPGGRH